MNNNSYIVMKFGGTSVTGLSQWKNITSLCAATLKLGKRPFLVCSALAGTSDLLIELLDKSARGDFQQCLNKIQEKHFLLLTDMQLDHKLIETLLAELQKLCEGVSLLAVCDPATRARVLAYGELLSTTIGAAWLRAQGLNVYWLDARDYLVSKTSAGARPDQQFLSAVVSPAEDDSLQLEAARTDICITQGFIASNSEQQTVLLGRGGSDTSAALFAVALAARRLEIWTDVPGMFTANPRQVDSANLILRLNYAEAQELATTGAKVLHPACIGPLRQARIPLHIRWTAHPEIEGTVISATTTGGAGVKGISSKQGIWLVSMESFSMWQHAGFLADVFAVFKRFSISIDHVSTSESNVTVSLDSGSNVLDEKLLEDLLQALREYCQPSLIGPVATVTLVGSRIRSTLHQLGPAFGLFEDKQIYLLSQAASDLNLSIATGEDEAGQLVELLHANFFSGALRDEIFGPTWLELADHQRWGQVTPGKPRWWQQHRSRLVETLAGQPAAYIYALPEISRAVAEIRGVTAFSRLHFAMKANSNPQVLRLLAGEGVDFDCVSTGEIELLLKTCPGLDPDRILFTPNFAAIEEYQLAYELGCRVTLDNLYCLETHPRVFAGRDLVVRLDPESVPAGHHKYVQTTGRQSKFGIAATEVGRLVELCARHQVRVYALHSHVGSGIHNPHAWLSVADYLTNQAKQFPEVRVLDLGGGFGVEEQPGQASLDFSRLQRLLAGFQRRHPRFELWAEPGRFLVSTAGVLLARVNQTKSKDGKYFVGIAAGMNALIRPGLYGAFHPIYNLTRLDEEPDLRADVVGPICETGDVLGHDRWLPPTGEGDILLIANCGAYARVMASTYNAREIPPEICIDSYG